MCGHVRSNGGPYGSPIQCQTESQRLPAHETGLSEDSPFHQLLPRRKEGQMVVLRLMLTKQHYLYSTTQQTRREAQGGKMATLLWMACGACNGESMAILGVEGPSNGGNNLLDFLEQHHVQLLWH